MAWNMELTTPLGKWRDKVGCSSRRFYALDRVTGIPTSSEGSTKTPFQRTGAETNQENTEVEHVQEEHVRSVSPNMRADANLKRKRQRGALGHCSQSNSQAARVPTRPKSVKTGPASRLGKPPGKRQTIPFRSPSAPRPKDEKKSHRQLLSRGPGPSHSKLSVPESPL